MKVILRIGASTPPDELSDDNHRDFDFVQSDDENDQPTSGIRSL